MSLNVEVSENNKNEDNAQESVMSSPNQTDDISTKPQLEIGDRYRVLRDDNAWYSAEIIEVRPNDRSSEGYEYFLHYDGLNHRLDEWVDRSRFDITSCQKNSRSNNPIAAHEGDQKVTEVKYLDTIRFGKNWNIKTWYCSPYPGIDKKQSKLFICEYCLKYMTLPETFSKHHDECTTIYPPGKEIYENDSLCVNEVDGKYHKVFCQYLCLLAKLFVEHKTHIFDVEPYLFYLLTKFEKGKYRLIGFFSKLKEYGENNLSCILILPPFQKNGFGKFLIAFSYELAKKQHFVGSPEKPLSSLAENCYRSYWSWAVVNTLKEHGVKLSVTDICQMTNIAPCDIMSTLQNFRLEKYLKGERFTTLTSEVVDQWFYRPWYCKKPKITVDVSRLLWTPIPKRIYKLMRLL